MSLQRTSSGLLVATGLEGLGPVAGRCNLCGAEFTEREVRGSVMQNHAVHCVRQNEDKIHEKRQRERGFFDAGDEEAERWTIDHASEITEGRKSDVYGIKRRRDGRTP